MSLATWHYITGGMLVLVCTWQLVSFAAGATLTRRMQALNLVTTLVLALTVLFQ